MVQNSSSNGERRAAAPQPPPLELGTLRERLLTREGGISVTRGSLLRCAHRYRDFVERVLAAADHPDEITNEDSESIEAAKESLQRELKLHGLEMRKVALVADAAEAELAQYHAAQLQIDRDVADAKGEIEALKLELTHEKRVRKNREEYESLAKMANVRPARRQTEMKLAQVRAEMEQIRAEEARTMRELEVREKQFHLLMQSVFDLKASLAEDVQRQEVAKGDDDEDNEEEEEEEEEEGLEEGEDGQGTVPMDTTL